MTDDLLKQYTSALRQEFDGASAAPEATRARVIRNLAERKPRRAKWWAIGIPALALLGGSTAWAAAHGQLGVMVKQATIALGLSIEDEVEAPAPAPAPRRPGAQAVTAAPVEKVVEEDESLAAPAEEPEDPAPRVTSPLPRSATETPQGPSPEELAQKRAQEEQEKAIIAYKKGHDAHYGQGNCATAISAYDSYLRQYPAGSFVLEARYNRAVCLVQVGRLAEAQTALRPFAQGQLGGYRQTQAQSLLDALFEATDGDESDAP